MHPRDRPSTFLLLVLRVNPYVVDPATFEPQAHTRGWQENAHSSTRVQKVEMSSGEARQRHAACEMHVTQGVPVASYVVCTPAGDPAGTSGSTTPASVALLETSPVAGEPDQGVPVAVAEAIDDGESMRRVRRFHQLPNALLIECPPGAPTGGQWVETEFFGPWSACHCFLWSLIIGPLACLLLPCMACDRILLYRDPTGIFWNSSGTIVVF